MATKQQEIDALKKEKIELQAKLEVMEKMYRELLRATASPEGTFDIRKTLHRLTLKQHATMLATLAGKSYAEIAQLLKADETTVKLHLKAAITHLGAENRGHLIAEFGPKIDAISEEEYAKSYRISKHWITSQDKALMEELTRKRSSLHGRK